MRPCPLLVSVFALGLSTAVACASGNTGSSRAEPAKALLPVVDASWRAHGWHAVVPHAFVVRKLLAVRTAPRPDAPLAFYLKGGTRIPVVDQGLKWWRISWTEGRTGWVPVRDVEPHAAFVLIDAHSGRMVQRIAAKGQWGAVSDGASLWSIANTGITRTLLGTRPAIWSKAVAADRDALFPDWSVWNPERSRFYLRAGGAEQGALLRTNVLTGEIRTVGTPPPGELAGLTPSGAMILDGAGEDGELAHLYAPDRKRSIRRIAGDVQAVTRSGVTFLKRGKRLVRLDSQLHATAQVGLPDDVQGVCLSADERYVAASYETTSATGEVPVRVRIFNARTLRPVLTLSLPKGSYCPYLRGLGYWEGGWWVASGGEGEFELAARFRRDGRLLKFWEGLAPSAISADGTHLYMLGEGGIASIQPVTGRRQVFPFMWRRTLPAQFLPKPSEFGSTHLDASSLTLTPNGKTLILTEWLNGDPAG